MTFLALEIWTDFLFYLLLSSFVKPFSQIIVCQQTLLFHQLIVNKALVSVAPTEMALAVLKTRAQLYTILTNKPLLSIEIFSNILLNILHPLMIIFWHVSYLFTAGNPLLVIHIFPVSQDFLLALSFNDLQLLLS